MSETVTVGLAQISPVWLKREATFEKVIAWVGKAADQGCDLVAFGESLVPGYPFWISHTDGASFESDFQKEMFAHYLDQAVCIEQGHLDQLCQVAADANIVVMVGCYERALDRGGHTGYCSLVSINATGEIVNVHRKAVPTYEERLVWGQGDGHGLRTFPLGRFTLGGLNCWENWMPLMRTALYAQGEDLHVAIWPGSTANTQPPTQFLAREGRSFVLSVSGILASKDIPDDIPHAATLQEKCPARMADGGSCIAGPDGQWIVPPVDASEQLVTATLDHRFVRRERQNFDPTGHYSRPDITQLHVNRKRQSNLEIRE